MALFIDGQEILTLRINGQHIETLRIDGQVVARKPIITTQPTGSTITDADSYTLSVVADGLNSTMSYQWYSSDDVAIDGATGTSYTFTPSSTGSFGFYCRVTGFGGYTQTDTVTVIVESAWSHVITKGHSDDGLVERWGFVNIGEPTSDIGELAPRAIATDVTCYEIVSDQNFTSEEEHIWIRESVPVTSYIIMQTTAGTWTASYKSYNELAGTSYLLDPGCREWLRTQATDERINLTYHSA